VVGGTVGGLVAVAAIIYALRFRRKTPIPAELDTQIYTPSFNPDDVGSQASHLNMARVPASSSLQSPTLYPNQASDIPLPQNSNSSPSANFFTPIGAINSDAVQRSLSRSPLKDHNISGASSSRPDSPDDGNIPNQLTDEQAAYVRTMYDSSVPIPAIAVLVDRMLQEGRRTGQSSIGNFGVSRGNTTATMPPSYTDS